jgi:signal transduction histidine kinase
VQLAVFRILQEALTNALRHGGDGPVRVRLAWFPDHCELAVRSLLPAPGKAPTAAPRELDAADPPRTPGHGIIGMRERAQLVGGYLHAAPDGPDFVVAATLPIGVLA